MSVLNENDVKSEKSINNTSFVFSKLGKYTDLSFSVLLIVTLFSIGLLSFIFFQTGSLYKLDDENIQKDNVVAVVEDENMDQEEVTPEKESDKEIIEKDADQIEGINEEGSDGELIVIQNRKVILREGDSESIPPWNTIKTFDIDGMVERLYVNDNNEMFIYGVYLDSGRNVYDEEIGDRFTWYLYDVNSGESKKISGLKFVSVNDIETEVDLVYGWISENEIVVGEEGWMALGEIAVYNVETEELRGISENEFLEFDL